MLAVGMLRGKEGVHCLGYGITDDFSLLISLICGMRSITVSMQVSPSDIGNASHTPSSCRERGSINIRGIKNKKGLDMAITNDCVAFTTDRSVLSPGLFRMITVSRCCLILISSGDYSIPAC